MANKTIRLNFPPEAIQQKIDKLLAETLNNPDMDKIDKAVTQDFHTLISLGISCLAKKPEGKK